MKTPGLPAVPEWPHMASKPGGLFKQERSLMVWGRGRVNQEVRVHGKEQANGCLDRLLEFVAFCVKPFQENLKERPTVHINSFTASSKVYSTSPR